MTCTYLGYLSLQSFALVICLISLLFLQTKFYFGLYKIQSLCENMFWMLELKCLDNSIFFTIQNCFLYLWFKSFNIRCKCCTIECNFTGFKMKMFSLFHQLKKEINSTFTKNRRKNLHIYALLAHRFLTRKKKRKKKKKRNHYIPNYITRDNIFIY